MNATVTMLRRARARVSRLGTRLASIFGRRVHTAFERVVCALTPAVPSAVPARSCPTRAFKVLLPALAAGLALGALPPAAGAVTSGATRWDTQADGRLVDVGILVDGASAPLYLRPGQWDRHYVEAIAGRNYAITIRNNTGQRVGVLISVDGLNVVSGTRSTLSRNESMYVLGPWERAVISGWRTSLSSVRRFVFVDESRSYAERTGQANGDMGWIRVLAFRELVPQVRLPEFSPYQGRGKEGSAPAPDRAPRGSLDSRKSGEVQSPNSLAPRAESSFPGTGWGDRQHDPVQRTRFTPERYATDQLVIRYEYASGLRALGIFPRRSRLWEREHGELGFAQPPRW